MRNLENHFSQVVRILGIVACLLFYNCIRRENWNPFDSHDISKYKNDQIQLITYIPGMIRSNPLVIRGTAPGFDTVFCEGGINTVEKSIDQYGLFDITVPVQEERKNILQIYAKNSEEMCSDTLSVVFTHISDNSIYIPDLPKYTHQNYFTITGSAPYYLFAYCRIGNQTIVDTVRNDHFSLYVPLMINQKNDFIIYAEDTLGQKSDTIQASVYHDNQLPKLIHSSTDDESFELNNGSILFHFDKPVIPGRIQLDFGNYNYGDFDTVHNQDPQTIEALYNHFRLANDYKIKVMVSDSAGNRLDTTCTFKTYFTKLDFNFIITDIFRSIDGSKVFILGRIPNVLVVVNTSTWEIEAYHPLSYVPYRGDQNPANRSLYIASYENRLITEVDAQSGQEMDFIHTVRNESEVYWPDKPVSIAFCENGIGFVTCLPAGSSGPYSIQALNSNNNNQIEIHHQFYPDTYKSLYAYHFNNRKNLLLAELGISSSTAYIYNPAQDEFVQILSQGLSDNNIGFVLGHHKEDLINLGQVYSFLFDSAGHLMGQTGYKVLSDTYDFTYLENENTWAYYYDRFEYEFGIIDLTDGEKWLNYRYGGDISTLLTTYDGEFVILQSQTEIVVLKTRTFRDITH